MASYWAGRRVIVTGAGGFVGSHLTERLVQEGAAVTAFVHYNALQSSGWISNGCGAQIVFGDITDGESVRGLLANQQVVFHLAALIAIPYSYIAPRSYIRTNIEGTLNVCQSCLAAGVETLVHTSTSEVYGTAKQVPISEEHPLQGQSPYSASKIGADKMVEAFACSFDLNAVIARPFNTFGPRQSPRAVIPTIVTQLMKGPEVHLGALTPTRDLNYVTNTVDGFLAAARGPFTKGQSLNFGSGQEISIGDLVLKIGQIMGVTPNVTCETTRIRPKDSEVERLLADYSLAQRQLEWNPAVTLDEGLEKTVDWFRANQSLYVTKGFVV